MTRLGNGRASVDVGHEVPECDGGMADIGEPKSRGEARSAGEVMTQRAYCFFESMVVDSTEIATPTTNPPAE